MTTRINDWDHSLIKLDTKQQALLFPLQQKLLAERILRQRVWVLFDTCFFVIFVTSTIERYEI